MRKQFLIGKWKILFRGVVGSVICRLLFCSCSHLPLLRSPNFAFQSLLKGKRVRTPSPETTLSENKNNCHMSQQGALTNLQKGPLKTERSRSLSSLKQKD